MNHWHLACRLKLKVSIATAASCKYDLYASLQMSQLHASSTRVSVFGFWYDWHWRLFWWEAEESVWSISFYQRLKSMLTPHGAIVQNLEKD